LQEVAGAQHARDEQGFDEREIVLAERAPGLKERAEDVEGSHERPTVYAARTGSVWMDSVDGAVSARE
jgi:hypothetical protein